jgi:hypothetical protein
MTSLPAKRGYEALRQLSRPLAYCVLTVHEMSILPAEVALP